jgi:ComF family protein
VNAFDDLLDLLLPTGCALCAARGAPICEACQSSLEWQPRLILRDNLQGFVVSNYETVEQKLIHSFKEKGQTSLLAYLAKPLVPALVRLSQGVSRPLLVPIPSSDSNYLKRGFVPAKVFAHKLNSLAKRPARVADLLSFNRSVADQSQLDVLSRSLNLKGSMSGDQALAGRSVILIDDIVTSGATILEGARAAVSAGATVVGFLAFSETILKTGSKT